LIGLLLIGLIIWFLGPYIAIGDFKPFESLIGRAIALAVVMLLWGFKWLFRAFKAQRASANLAKQVVRPAEDPGSARASADAKQLQQRFSEAIDALQKSKKGQVNLYALPWYIIIGPPGSGKTTALLQLARYMVGATVSDKENKVIILENEVGEVGIDDAYLRSGGLTVNNLFSGCACCTVSGELVSAAIRIRNEFDPDWLIVETTGIAYPKNMQENLQNAIGLSSRIVILVDASRWNRLLLPMNSLLRGQIEGSDAVLINKTDLADGAALEKIEQDILGFEPNAVVLRISALREVPAEVWRKVTGEGAAE
jgi:Ni2+-binding GTPase involved in maturation of urease and hydrogenase